MNDFMNRWYIPAIFASLLGFAFLFYPFILNGFDFNYLWQDDFDPNLMTWIFERNFIAIKNPANWLNFWDANQFYPYKNTLAYSDSMLSGQLFYLPMRLLGFTGIQSLYATLYGFILLGALLSSCLLNKLLKVDFISTLLFVVISQFSLSTTNFLGSHYQLFAFQLAPSFFLLCFVLLKQPSSIYLFFTTLLFCLIGSFATYFVPMSLAVVLPIVIFKFGTSKTLWTEFTKKILNQKFYLASSILLLAIFFIVQLYPYIKVFSTLEKQNWNETVVYSAKLWSIFVTSSPFSLLYSITKATNGYWEYAYFPGMVIISLVSISVLFKFCNRTENCTLIGELTTYALLILCASYILSLGPYKTLNSVGIDSKIYMPFALMAKIIPGLDNVRAPGRFGLFFGFSFAILTLSLLRFIGANFPTRNYKFISIIVLLLFLYDSSIRVKLIPFRITNADFKSNVSRYITPNEPLLELPLNGPNHIDTIKNYMEQMKGANLNGSLTVSGYGSRSTDTLSTLTDMDRRVQIGEIKLKELIEYSSSLSIHKMIICGNIYNKNTEEINSYLTPIISEENCTLFEVKAL